MEVSNSNIENFFYVSGNKKPKKTSYIFSKESFSYISGNQNSKKVLYISENRTFL